MVEVAAYHRRLLAIRKAVVAVARMTKTWDCVVDVCVQDAIHARSTNSAIPSWSTFPSTDSPIHATSIRTERQSSCTPPTTFPGNLDLRSSFNSQCWTPIPTNPAFPDLSLVHRHPASFWTWFACQPPHNSWTTIVPVQSPTICQSTLKSPSTRRRRSTLSRVVRSDLPNLPRSFRPRDCCRTLNGRIHSCRPSHTSSSCTRTLPTLTLTRPSSTPSTRSGSQTGTTLREGLPQNNTGGRWVWKVLPLQEECHCRRGGNHHSRPPVYIPPTFTPCHQDNRTTGTPC